MLKYCHPTTNYFKLLSAVSPWLKISPHKIMRRETPGAEDDQCANGRRPFSSNRLRRHFETTVEALQLRLGLCGGDASGHGDAPAATSEATEHATESASGCQLSDSVRTAPTQPPLRVPKSEAVVLSATMSPLTQHQPLPPCFCRSMSTRCRGRQPCREHFWRSQCQCLLPSMIWRLRPTCTLMIPISPRYRHAGAVGVSRCQLECVLLPSSMRVTRSESHCHFDSLNLKFNY